MSQTLYLIRHGEAESWSPMGNDFARALTPGGAKHLKLLSDWMKANLEIPDTILCSSANRTRQTLAPILAHWHQRLSGTDYVDSMYNAGMDVLMTLLEDAFSYCDCVLMVGHNPAIENLLKYLLRSVHSDGMGHYAPGTLSVVRFENGFSRESTRVQLVHLLKETDLSGD